MTLSFRTLELHRESSTPSASSHLRYWSNFVLREVSWKKFDQTLNILLHSDEGACCGNEYAEMGKNCVRIEHRCIGGGINGPHYAASVGGLRGLNVSTRLAG